MKATLLSYEYYKIKEKLQFWVAWKVPKWLVYFCGIRMIANATTKEYSNTLVSEITAMDALERWKK